ncbi:hypothetical protein RclHR1_01740008 [Rhizophagus clarus]|uniref:Uncharacterized protein n=1 Tax=Rhizophagus clarus TaxID=94130 RepID=A0A2Z6R0E3_9GLOM|nr:hypothetical protein RclHR1_01740008 [Rhizophagus clarus]
MRGRSKERNKTQEHSKDRSRMRGRSKERKKLSNNSHRYSYLLECLKHYDENKQLSKILESGIERHVIASLSSSVKSSNKPVMIISSDNRSGEEEL